MKKNKIFKILKTLNFIILYIFIMHFLAFADATLLGPAGYIYVPNHRLPNKGQFEFGIHTQKLEYINNNNRINRHKTNLAVNFSFIQNFEISLSKAIITEGMTQVSDTDPDPIIGLKVKLPAIGDGDLSEPAFGILLDTNPNNYHTLYFTLRGFGIGYNFGGNKYSGIANLGSYDKSRHEPKKVCLLLGLEYPSYQLKRQNYQGYYIVDYNGDFITFVYRYKSARGFWFDVGYQTKSSYTELYVHQPIIFGVGGNF